MEVLDINLYLVHIIYIYHDPDTLRRVRAEGLV